MKKHHFLIKILTVVALSALATIATADVYFNWARVAGSNPTDTCYHFENQGRFFASSDYGYTPGKDDQLSSKKLGLKWNKSCPYVRGQNPTICSRLGRGFYGIPWLSDGGDCVFGLNFEKNIVPNWERDAEEQFKRFSDNIPSFDRVIIHWGRQLPKAGSWGACILDADGKLHRIEIDKNTPLYPYDQSVLSFSPTTVKKIYFGVRGGDNKNNFVEIRDIALLLHSEALLDDRVIVDQPDAYRVYYSKQPGEIERLLLRNYYFKAPWDAVLLRSLTPFLEFNGKRLTAVKAGSVSVTEEGATDILRYRLDFGPGGAVDVTAIYSLALKNGIRFCFKAKNLPENAKLGFSMSGNLPLFVACVNDTATVELSPQVIETPAGPFGFSLDGADTLTASRQNSKVLFETIADDNELEIGFSLPIGPHAGLQPNMLSYFWYNSLASRGDEGTAPFSKADLELLETINLGDPNDPHKVYDISNDPLILKWRVSGKSKLPSQFGKLKYITEPEKGKVPISKVLGESCRDLGSNETTYFRFNLKTRIEPRIPYLLVVEHAFDKERRGEFHSVGVSQDNANWRNLQRCPAPFGGFDTGKGPQPGKFKKESIFLFEPGSQSYKLDTTISLCFSNTPLSCYFRESERNSPCGLAVKSVTLYRVAHLPALADLSSIFPDKNQRRHVTMESENFSPWMMEQFPRLYGYDTLWTHRQPAAQFLYGGGYMLPYPGWRKWTHCNGLEVNRWLYSKAANERVAIKTSLGWLLSLGFEGSGHDSFLGVGWLPGPTWGSIPISPTEKELEHIASALARSLGALDKYPSLAEISIGDIPAFSKRDLEDFSKQTGIPFNASPAPEENVKRLLASPKKTVDAWVSWVCRKRHKFLCWLLDQVRSHRSDLYLTLNQGWYINGLQGMWHGNQWPYDTAELKTKGIDSYLKFLKFIGYDPSLYSKGNGFAFGMEMKSPSIMSNGNGKGNWPFNGDGPVLRDGFGGGLSVSTCFFDESPKPLQRWGCNYMKSQRDFRKEFVEALVNGNAREYIFQSYYFDSVRGRLADLRDLAVPFRLLPFAKPEPYPGKLVDDVKQARINKYGNRYCLANVGDRPSTATLTLPEGTESIVDLSNGIRQVLRVEKGAVTFHLPAWSLKTLEIK